jgi:hypothetical protein
MATSSLTNAISIVDYKRPFNIDLGSITEYFSAVLATDGNINRGALKNGNLLFKEHFIHSINVYKQYVKRTISAKCRAQMKKATTYQVNSFARLMKVLTRSPVSIFLVEHDH